MGGLLSAEISASGSNREGTRISTVEAQESQKSKVSKFQGFMVSGFMVSRSFKDGERN